MKSSEVRNLNASIESLKSVNEELKVCSTVPYVFPSVDEDVQLQRAFAVTSAGIEGGKNLAESAQDLERTRKAINVQLAEFDGVKKSLMRDLQNRCEKVWRERRVCVMYTIMSYSDCSPQGGRIGNSTRRDQGAVQQRHPQ